MAHREGDWMGQTLIECNYGASSSKTLSVAFDPQIDILPNL